MIPQQPEFHFKQPGWQTAGDSELPELDHHFTAAVMQAANNRIVYRDLLFMILEGFWSILKAFLNIKSGASGEADQGERQSK